MFFPEGAVRVHVYGQPVDMRKSFDGLYALTRQALGCDPLSGELFVFINRRGTQMKVLYWDRTGFCVWATGVRHLTPIFAPFRKVPPALARV